MRNLAFLMGFLSISAYGFELEVMSYNVENFFDAVKDEGKDDWSFLPKDYPGKAEHCASIRNERYRGYCERSNWTEAHILIKRAKIKEALTEGRAKLPEILAVQEVENENVVGMIAETLGYEHYAATNSPDRRGIDVGLMWKEHEGFRKIGVRTHRVEGLSKPSRDVLEVEFDVGGEKLFVFVCHWPSQANPSTDRVLAARVTRAVAEERIARGGSVIITGDFNTLESDYPHPFKGVLLDGLSEEAPKLADVESIFNEAAYQARKQGLKTPVHPLGTYFYPPKMSWNQLDRFFVDDSLNDGRGLELDPLSYSIHTPDKLTKTYTYTKSYEYLKGSTVLGVPHRYEHETLNADEAGFSDHFGISMKLFLTSSQVQETN